MSSRKGAMEMSMGTIVTIVLLMSVLVLGVVLVQKIFKTGTSAIKGIDTKVQSEIENLFSSEGKAKVIVVPKEREIEISQGEDGGFALAFSNQDPDDGTFSYTVKASRISKDCKITLDQADNLIALGESGDGINIPSGGDNRDSAIFVKFNVPETVPLCTIRYGVDVKKDGQQYTNTIYVDVKIV